MDFIRRIRHTKKIKSQAEAQSIQSSHGEPKKLDVNEEYNEVFRSTSYIEFSSKVEEHLTRKVRIDEEEESSASPSLPSYHLLPSYVHLSDYFLEPSQESVIDMVKSSTHNNILRSYYNTSLDACNLCERVLRSIQQIRAQHTYIQSTIEISNNNTHHLQMDRMAKDLTSFASLTNPLSIISTKKFSDIHNSLSILLEELTTKHKCMIKLKPARFCKRVFGYGLSASYSVLAVALLVIAVHSIVGLIGIPGVLMLFPLGVSWKRMKMCRAMSKSSVYKRVCGQLDSAARGVYILINQLDTMGRLVVRLDNEVEHKKLIAGLCIRSYMRIQEVPREAVRELEMHEDGFLDQLDELEKHVYMCVLGINKARRLVIQGPVTL